MRLVKLFISILALTPMAFGSEPAPHGETAADTAYSGKQSQEWSDIQTKLAALKGKVEAQEALVKGLISEKSQGNGHGSQDADVTARVELLKKEDAKLQALIKEYNKMSSSYETRFPEKGLKESRIYRRVDPQALQADQAATNYEEKLQKLQNKIMRQYPKTAKKIQSEKAKKKPEKNKAEDKKHSSKKEEVRPASSNEVTDQIILQK